METRVTKPNILDMAKKKRHIFLLQKIQKGKALTPSELAELEKFEGKGLPAGVVDTREKVAKHFGVSVRTVYFWCRDGLPKTREGWFNLGEIQKWREQRDSKKKPEDSGKYWEKRKIKAQAQLVEVELKKKGGHLLDVDEVKKVAFGTARKVRDALLGIPDRLSTIFAAESDAAKIHSLLTQEINNALEGLSNALTS